MAPPRSMTISQRRKAIDEHFKTERPNKHTDRVAWNNHFEKGIELTYTGYSYERAPLLEKTLKKDQLEAEITELNQNIDDRTRELMDKEWKELRLQKKKDLALEGLYRGACNCPRDNSRVSCPEMTINSLVGNGEYNLINLLKRIMEHDPTGNRRVQELFLFKHPQVDHQYRFTDAAPDVVKAQLYLLQIYRTFVIVATLKGIINAYHGIPMVLQIPVVTSMPVRHGEEAEARAAAARKMLAQDKKSSAAVDQSQCKEMNAISYTACRTCFVKTATKNLKRCGQCQNVWYCSPQCQKKDWPEHKKSCRKQNFAPAPLAPKAPDEFIGCPVAAPGFIRTPALWRQIWYLSKPDSQSSDYHFDTKPGHTSSIAIRYPPGARLIFLVARRRAMASGSLPAIYKMLTILDSEEEMGLRNFTPAHYCRQFEKEYNIKITPESRREASEFASPTA
ncbi:hypothetical protein K438DRAFT_2027596 [Mycena galopus ATCC 62051]|nr:hypothetical protein K438DRAFT_2027596 [Mycena galopus ATCC 62051]